MEIIQSNLMNVIAAIVTTVASFVGVSIRNAYIKYVNTKTKKEVVQATTAYVEQVSKLTDLTSEEKFQKAKEKALEWLAEKGIKSSNTELEILIESAVNSFNKAVKEGK